MAQPSATQNQSAVAAGGPTRKPAIGNDVIYRHEVSGVPDHPAKITRVVDDRVVNLMVFFDGGGGSHWFEKVPYDGAAEPAKRTWRWPAR